MMEKLEKIFELLSKEQLNEEEKNFIQNAVSADAETEKFVSVYNKIKLFGRNSHPDDELIGEYVLLKNDETFRSAVNGKLLLNIENHIRECSRCSAVFKDLNEEYYGVQEFLENKISSTPLKTEGLKEGLLYRNSFPLVKYFAAALIIITVGLLGTYVTDQIITPDYKRTALGYSNDELYTTRGRTTEFFQRALFELDQNNLEEAINFLNKDIEESKNENSIFYSHYILGVTYINKGESKVIGILNRFDSEAINKGIEHLKKAIETNNTGRFGNISLDAHFFIGKAYLLIDQKDEAVNHLKIVVDKKGSYYKQAEELLRILQK